MGEKGEREKGRITWASVIEVVGVKVVGVGVGIWAAVRRVRVERMRARTRVKNMLACCLMSAVIRFGLVITIYG